MSKNNVCACRGSCSSSACPCSQCHGGCQCNCTKQHSDEHLRDAVDALAKAPPPLRLTKEQRAEETLCDTDDEAFDSLAWLKMVKKPLGASRTSPPGDAPVYSAACPPPAAPLPFSCPVRLMPPAFSSACELKGASLNAVSQHILDDHRDSRCGFVELPKGCEWTQGGSENTRHYLYPTSVTEPYPASLSATLKRDVHTPILLLSGSSSGVPVHPSRGCVQGSPPGGGSGSGGSGSSGSSEGNGGGEGKGGKGGSGEGLLSKPVSLPSKFLPPSQPCTCRTSLFIPFWVSRCFCCDNWWIFAACSNFRNE